MKGIKGLQFSFFILPNSKEENPSNASWTTGGFSKDQQELPGAIKLILTTFDEVEKKEKQKTYYFPVPQTLSLVTERT
jgi:hypothetical protein